MLMKKNQLEKHFATNYVNWKHVSNTTGDNHVILYHLADAEVHQSAEKTHEKLDEPKKKKNQHQI